jgi:Fe-S cluster assembly protein SufD
MTATNLPTWLQPLPETNSWLAAYRQRHWDDVVRSGLPTSRHERWKYADLSFLATQSYAASIRVSHPELAALVQAHRLANADSILLVSINGHYSAALSDLRLLPAGVIVCNMAEAMQQHTALIQSHWSDQQDNFFASMNAAMFSDGLFIHVPAHTTISTPIHCLSLAVGDQSFIAQPKHIVVLGEESKMTLFEDYAAVTDAAYVMNITTHLVLGDTSTLKNYKIQRESKAATHIANTFVRQGQHSQWQATYFSIGDEIAAKLDAAGAIASTGGYYYLTQDNQYIDYHIDVDHAAPRSQSEMTFKGVLNGKSRAVFNGRLHVIKDAQKITAHQANHNILLSNQAEVYSKPELEIYADDVKCKHGATIGQLDTEALFYLRSRGIAETEAMQLLLSGFADEILQRVENTRIRAHIEKVMSL